MKITSKVFYRVNDEKIMQYSLQNDHGMTLNFITFGARVQQVRLPNRAGMNPNLTIGFITFQDYAEDSELFGATIGPIAGANGDQPLNSGRTGWQNWNWDAETEEAEDHVSVKFSLRLGDGQDGLPGGRTVALVHTLDNRNRWTIDWHIETDTKVQLRPKLNVAYALTGDPAQSVMDQRLRLDAEPVPLPAKTLSTEATMATLTANDWALSINTEGPGLVVDTFAHLNEQNYFNGITGAPHTAVAIRPVTPLFTLMPGAPFERRTTVTLHALA